LSAIASRQFEPRVEDGLVDQMISTFFLTPDEQCRKYPAKERHYLPGCRLNAPFGLDLDFFLLDAEEGFLAEGFQAGSGQDRNFHPLRLLLRCGNVGLHLEKSCNVNVQ
jgi:hypothetical protein